MINKLFVPSAVITLLYLTSSILNSNSASASPNVTSSPAASTLTVAAKTSTSNKEIAPTRKPVRIKFATGTNSKTIKQSVIRGERDTYLVGAKRGQRINLKITSLEKNAEFDVIAPGGKTIKQGATSLSRKLPTTGDYQIVVGGTRGNASYELTMTIK